MPLSKKCLRYLTLIYDVIFGICAFMFMCVNSLILYKISKFKGLISINTLGPIITHIIAGFFFMLLSFCGWKVALKVHIFHLKLYGAFLAILTILQISCVIWIICILHSVIKVEINTNMEEQFSLLLDGNTNSISLWEGIQTQLNCCGIGGPTDYRKSNSVPWSCCKRISNEFSGDCTSVHQHGCLLNVYDEVYHYLMYSALSSFGMAIIHAVGVFSYFSLGKAIQLSLETSALSNNRNLQSFEEEETQLNLLNRSQRKC